MPNKSPLKYHMGPRLALLWSETGEERSNCKLISQTMLQENTGLLWQSIEFCDNLQKRQFCGCWSVDLTGTWVKQMAIYSLEALPCTPYGLPPWILRGAHFQDYSTAIESTSIFKRKQVHCGKVNAGALACSKAQGSTGMYSPHMLYAVH